MVTANTFRGNLGTALGVTGTLLTGAATLGLVLYKNHQHDVANEGMQKALDQADATGCYSRQELIDWYYRDVVG